MVKANAGKWTDDTEMMLCILDSVLACGQVDLIDIARRFYEWATNAGFGIGALMSKVIFDSDFLHQPQQVALNYWEQSGQTSALWHPELSNCFAQIRNLSLEVFDLDQGTNKNEPVIFG